MLIYNIVDADAPNIEPLNVDPISLDNLSADFFQDIVNNKINGNSVKNYIDVIRNQSNNDYFHVYALQNQCVYHSVPLIHQFSKSTYYDTSVSYKKTTFVGLWDGVTLHKPKYTQIINGIVINPNNEIEDDEVLRDWFDNTETPVSNRFISQSSDLRFARLLEWQKQNNSNFNSYWHYFVLAQCSQTNTDQSYIINNLLKYIPIFKTEDITPLSYELIAPSYIFPEYEDRYIIIDDELKTEIINGVEVVVDGLENVTNIVTRGRLSSYSNPKPDLKWAYYACYYKWSHIGLPSNNLGETRYIGSIIPDALIGLEEPDGTIHTCFCVDKINLDTAEVGVNIGDMGQIRFSKYNDNGVWRMYLSNNGDSRPINPNITPTSGYQDMGYVVACKYRKKYFIIQWDNFQLQKKIFGAFGCISRTDVLEFSWNGVGGDVQNMDEIFELTSRYYQLHFVKPYKRFVYTSNVTMGEFNTTKNILGAISNTSNVQTDNPNNYVINACCTQSSISPQRPRITRTLTFNCSLDLYDLMKIEPREDNIITWLSDINETMANTDQSTITIRNNNGIGDQYRDITFTYDANSNTINGILSIKQSFAGDRDIWLKLIEKINEDNGTNLELYVTNSPQNLVTFMSVTIQISNEWVLYVEGQHQFDGARWRIHKNFLLNEGERDRRMISSIPVQAKFAFTFPFQ